MTSREQFEAQIRLHTDESEIEDRLEKANGGLNYAHPETDVAWIWWQASREAVEVELPQEAKCRFKYPEAEAQCDGFNDALSQCDYAIRAAGIKVIEGEKKNG